ncbi:hypothetical protein [Mycobacterium sp.]|uniref:hypothetical protein n=1 Tax=Mycobacterium sp. TaxID=1785 RepID=UPI0025EB32D4|nr:hypothetical protein [Mycobacterium sp.]
MAVLPRTRFTAALTIGLALGGATLVGPAPARESLVSTVAIGPLAPLDDPPPAPDPDPAPSAHDAPGDPGPVRAAPAPHRRHIDNDPIFRR